MSASTSPHASHEPWRLASVWAGILVGPVVWLFLLEYNYALSYVACETRSTWFMHAAVAISVGLVASSGLLAWRARFAAIDAREEPTHPLSDETGTQRSDWMSLAGVLISGWFILVILAMEIPILVLRECQ